MKEGAIEHSKRVRTVGSLVATKPNWEAAVVASKFSEDFVRRSWPVLQPKARTLPPEMVQRLSYARAQRRARRCARRG